MKVIWMDKAGDGERTMDLLWLRVLSWNEAEMLEQVLHPLQLLI